MTKRFIAYVRGADGSRQRLGVFATREEALAAISQRKAIAKEPGRPRKRTPEEQAEYRRMYQRDRYRERTPEQVERDRHRRQARYRNRTTEQVKRTQLRLARYRAKLRP